MGSNNKQEEADRYFSSIIGVNNNKSAKSEMSQSPDIIKHKLKNKLLFFEVIFIILVLQSCALTHTIKLGKFYYKIGPNWEHISLNKPYTFERGLRPEFVEDPDPRFNQQPQISPNVVGIQSSINAQISPAICSFMGNQYIIELFRTGTKGSRVLPGRAAAFPITESHNRCNRFNNPPSSYDGALNLQYSDVLGQNEPGISPSGARGFFQIMESTGVPLLYDSKYSPTIKNCYANFGFREEPSWNDIDSIAKGMCFEIAVIEQKIDIVGSDNPWQVSNAYLGMSCRSTPSFTIGDPINNSTYCDAHVAFYNAIKDAYNY